jgi:hypothetical protein
MAVPEPARHPATGGSLIRSSTGSFCLTSLFRLLISLSFFLKRNQRGLGGLCAVPDLCYGSIAEGCMQKHSP